jgi:magnesium chelatase family protein
VSKIPGPLLDRIDIHIDVPVVKYKELRAPADAQGSEAVRQRVIKARERQMERYAGEAGLYSNAQMPAGHIRKFCAISADREKLLETAIERLGLSGRAHDRILEVGHTIADLDGSEGIELQRLSGTIQ